MSKNKDYAEQYAEQAKQQMRRYGIPASITLAQAILESASGQSQLARKENNHFGIKATKQWIAGGGRYGVYSDDRPNDKFCSYDSVADSYEHHSKFLKNNARYSKCFQLAPDDYKGWSEAIAKAGYATGGNYAAKLQQIIERNGLDKYDKEVIKQMRAEGKSFGTAQNPNSKDTSSNRKQPNGRYSFPVKRDEFLLVTSPFGMRTDPMNRTQKQMHKGIDINCRSDAVLATENGGKVVAVNQNTKTAGGKSVTVQYTREDGTKMQCVYCHLSSTSVKVGDTVSAGQRLGVSGNTGTRTTGEHLHFGVRQINADGSRRDIDPAAYLADIAAKGDISLKLMSNGKDLLAKYKEQEQRHTSSDQDQDQANGIDPQLSPDEWMKKLLSSEDSGAKMATGDPIMEFVMTMFTSLMALALQIDNKSEEEKMQAATEAALTKRIDLTSLVPALKECTLTIAENSKALLQMNDGTNCYNHELTSSEINRLRVALSDTNMSDDNKRATVANVVSNALLSERASQNYNQAANNNQEQTMQIK